MGKRGGKGKAGTRLSLQDFHKGVSVGAPSGLLGSRVGFGRDSAGGAEDSAIRGALQLGVGHSVEEWTEAEAAPGPGLYSWRIFLTASYVDGASGAEAPVADLTKLFRKVQWQFPPGSYWASFDMQEGPFEARQRGGEAYQTDVRVRISFTKAIPHPPVVIDHAIELERAPASPGGATLSHSRSLDLTESIVGKMQRMNIVDIVAAEAAEKEAEKEAEADEGPADAGGGVAGAPPGGGRGDRLPFRPAAFPGAKEEAGPAPALEIGVRTNWEIEYSSLEFAEPKVRMGSGGYGEVFKAKWNGIAVAVKELLEKDPDEEQVQDFRREVSTISALRHPSIVLWLGCVLKPQAGGALAIVMEYCAGGSLGRILHSPKAQSLTSQVRVKWAVTVAEGMAYLHSLNIVHRDLNSNNVLIDKKGNAKVCDFGLAQVRKTQTARTSKGRGTTSYTAPEVIKCSPWNERADVFSFGVLLWELTHLTRPWEGFADYQVMYQVAERGARLPFAEGLDAGLQHLIETCWAEDPAQRPPFDQLLTALHELPPDAMPMKTSGND